MSAPLHDRPARSPLGHPFVERVRARVAGGVTHLTTGSGELNPKSWT